MALTFGKCLLRDIRIQAGYTQDQLSEALLEVCGLNVSTTLLSFYETNKRPIPSLTMRGICIILGCNEKDIYEWPM
ncbi:helix-turn-helix transcriptional regulator [Paenibacillus sp. FSL R7-0026]|uniref:helix-turn-helix transcriptional regulator n=1 Tax=unclassified Paenibacillus TaxID=185978 RepID=UPI00123AE42C|nr:helix-turn-helix transcriptional regulator [Paenibacillus sp. UASWS1643]